MRMGRGTLVVLGGEGDGANGLYGGKWGIDGSNGNAGKNGESGLDGEMDLMG